MTSADFASILRTDGADSMETLRKRAYTVMLTSVGETVFYRGLLEYSNICSRDCYYCGIRKSNNAVVRYCLDIPSVVGVARWAAENGYGSLTLQGGERRDAAFVDLTVSMIRAIKQNTRMEELPEGLGITLCIGEQSRENYQRFFDAGAHRYLLRVETTNEDLFRRLHPSGDSLEDRIECLAVLKDIGYQVGSGVMIGLPGQSIDDLAADAEFLCKGEIDMVGMGPYLPHGQTPVTTESSRFGSVPDETTRLNLSLKMIAAVRLASPRLNIAATTALQTIHPLGRELGLRWGANILMPLVTPVENRKSYQLYDHKPCIDDETETCRDCLVARVATTRRAIGFNSWGDSPWFTDRKNKEAAHV